MNKKYVLLIMTLFLLVPVTGIAFSTQVTNPTTADARSQKLVPVDGVVQPIEVPEEIERLKEVIPRTFKETEIQVSPLRSRFLMWTHDGRHIMWGHYRTGYFVGTDNLGKRCWGIYGKGIFAGFYDGEFFYGKYGNGRWKAVDLFNEKLTHGRYVLFPTILEEAIAETLP